ncbi:transporter [candidate division MSBL1 archaeon SCGC-AAA259E22]|uniref:Transporter n=2 Tax=candidate division MSBL1 TaxID=215777 RepID=A0A133U5U3_9EURY|nr:transporter [candidate division MSBL1 archaeon SCGC-AAA259B11]KXA93343.1 transporter [candidate division MSBL1 archaeon SCGC-AAA259E22]
MPDGVYKRIEIIGTSPNSWEDAVENAVEKASETLDDLRVCEVDKLDTRIEDDEVVAYRARVKLSFKYQG